MLVHLFFQCTFTNGMINPHYQWTYKRESCIWQSYSRSLKTPGSIIMDIFVNEDLEKSGMFLRPAFTVYTWIQSHCITKWNDCLKTQSKYCEHIMLFTDWNKCKIIQVNCFFYSLQHEQECCIYLILTKIIIQLHGMLYFSTKCNFYMINMKHI